MTDKKIGGLAVLVPFAKPYRYNFLFVFFLVAVTEVISLSQPYIIKIAIDRYFGVSNSDIGKIFWIGAIYFVLTVLGFLFSYFSAVLLQHIGQHIVKKIRVQMFNHLQHLSMKYYDQNSSGKIITNIVNDTEAVNYFFTQFLVSMVQGSLSLILIMGIMLSLNIKISLYCFVVIPFIIFISTFFRRKLKKLNQEVRSKLSELMSFVSENLSGMKIIQIFSQEKKQYRNFTEKNQQLLHSSKNEVQYILVFNHILELLGDLSVAILIWIGGNAVIKENITFGMLYAFISYIRLFFQPINMITQQWNQLQSSIVSAERINTLLEGKSDNYGVTGAKTLKLKGQIQFNHVSFSYEKGHSVLHDIHFSIMPGEKIGIVGASGAGKTTIMNLLTRFYDVTDGTILIDEQDVKEWPIKLLRQSIGIVQQEVTFFTGTLLDNIRLFRHDVSEDQVKAACKIVGAEQFISKLPKGYLTVLTDKGSILSAGERQLLSFARVLIFNPQILILDEATAHLDTKTEVTLQNAVKKVSSGRTLLVIAHRLSTIRDMDRIIVLDDGKIVEEGSHDELIEKQGYYWKLHRITTKQSVLS